MSGAEINRSYVLVTVAYNEEDTLGAVIDAVTSQTHLPLCWILVSDGSTDRTDALMEAAAVRWSFVRFIRLERDPENARRLDKVTRAQARAMGVARELMKNLDYAFFGNLDADITFGPTYFETVIERCLKDPAIGIAGGGAYNVIKDGTVSSRGFVKPDFVGGPVQLFRRRCLDEIGGYAPYGHSDCVAVAKAKMKGWTVRCFPDLRAYHHGMPADTLREKVPVCFRMGQFDYIMGGQLSFELARAAARVFKRPYMIAGLALLTGYIRAWARGEPIEVPRDELAFMREEQRMKLRSRLGWRKRPGRGATK
ncbi:MAG: glycosyltransferase [Candidatus Aminicenantes bacterium]|nr:glycosyltransferase [Candidatus Aminicenantes bacterium]